MNGVAVLHLARGREWRGGERQVRLLAAAQIVTQEVRPTILTRAGSALARASAASAIRCVETRWTLPLDPRALLRATRSAS